MARYADWAPEQWRAAAAARLEDQARRAVLFQDYYDGHFPMTAITEPEDRRIFRRLLRESAANWCELVVNAVAERLQVVGFRFGTASDLAWTIWQANQMDADSELVQTDALVCASSFVLVQPDEDNPVGVQISGESPFEATVLYEPGNRRRRLAGYKRFPDGDDVLEVLILPDLIYTWLTEQGSSGQLVDVQANPAGLVPLVEVLPQPRTVRPPRSELTPAITFQDRINTTIFNRLVATDYGAFRQIWATGVKMARRTVEQPDGSQAVEAVKPFDVGANRLLVSENDQARFGAFAESTLAGYINAVGQDVQQLAAVTQTPPHYLLGSIVNASGDALKAAESGLVSKVRRRAAHIGEAWEEVMRTALGVVGDPSAVDVSAEVIWRDFETRSEAETVDALVKMATLGVPQQVLWQRWGASPQEVDRWAAMSAANQVATAQANAVALGAADPYAALLGAAGQAGAGAGQ